MSYIKAFYHEEISKIDEVELQKAEEIDRQYWEEQEIMNRAEEKAHSEMPEFVNIMFC